ncbi:MAG: Forkhead-associated protein, partial [Humibacillus sp.]|nr:Forkhead-associated protein [Humibacillus sp.]
DPAGSGNAADAGDAAGAGDPAASGASAGPADPATPAAPGPSSSAGAGAGPAAGAFEWVAEVWVDPDWYQTQEADDPCPSPGLPVIVALRDRSVLLGRASASRNTRPQIDLSSDPGVSRRHAQLTTDGTRWFVEDLSSSNGTFVGPAAGPLPSAAIAVGPRTELGDDDRLYVGAWTRVVVRRATPDEVEAYA